MGVENVRMGKKIAAARERRGWSKADLARKAGVAPSYITRIEQGAFGRPSIDLTTRIAEALGMSVGDLVELVPVSTRSVADLHAALMAKGFRPDQAPVVDQILSDLVGRTEDQQDEIINAVATLLALHKRNTNG